MPYWKATNANLKWQLLFDAVIKSKIIYGLESACSSHTSHDEKNRRLPVDAFQLRCLRKILGLAPTFIDGRNTNQAELKKCTDIVFTHREDHKKISLFSEYYLHRKTKLLGHVLRAPEYDPLRQVSLEPNSGNRVDYGKRRCGRPKQNWLHFAKKTAYEMHLNGSNYLECRT